MTQPIHIVLDLETWGTQPGDDLRSIGACVFDPLTGQMPTGVPGIGLEWFYIAVDNPGISAEEAITCLPNGETAVNANYPFYDATSDMYRKYNLRRDPNTVKWWSEQSAEAQAAFFASVDLNDGLYRFAAWLDGLTGRDSGVMPDFSVFRIWAHGANFDPGMISAAFRAVGLPDIIHYRSPRDTRTIFEAAGMDPATCLNDFQHDGAIYHHALHDAIVEARAICEAHRRLGLQDPLMRQATPVTVLEDLRTALRFYAPQELWDDMRDDENAAVHDRNTGSVLGDDQGAVARAALNGETLITLKPINLNDNVRVKLNDHGRAIAAEASLTVEEDAEGFSEWQLWHLMHTYGANLYNGCALPFKSAVLTPSPG